MNKQKFDFIGKQKAAFIVSLVLLLISIISLAVQGLSLGLDFTGGALIEVGFEEPVELDEIRQSLEANQFENVIVQQYGSAKDILVRVEADKTVKNSKVGDAVFNVISEQVGEGATLRRVEFVGPKVGEELSEKGGLALLVALFGILIYVSLRFEYRFAFGSVIALMHDVLITLGVFSLFQIDFDLTVLAALLAVIGYSLNDTIVVFDRIRENFLKLRKADSPEVVNISLNQTFSRTIVTSLTTLLVLVALFFLGGELIKSFALGLIIGVLIGTYSSIFVASTTILALGISKQDLLPPEKEGAEQEDVFFQG